jgi:hypothetical protein
MSMKDLVVNLVGLSLMVLVAVGYKTKLASLVMVCWLLGLNCIMNDFWRHRSTSIMWDFKKYDFFQVRKNSIQGETQYSNILGKKFGDFGRYGARNNFLVQK